jgi:hypothetical protein
MADIVDDANERAQELLHEALAKRKPLGPPPCGFCYHCGERIAGGLRHCDADCAADWERLQVVERDREGKYYDE